MDWGLVWLLEWTVSNTKDPPQLLTLFILPAISKNNHSIVITFCVPIWIKPELRFPWGAERFRDIIKKFEIAQKCCSNLPTSSDLHSHPHWLGYSFSETNQERERGLWLSLCPVCTWCPLGAECSISRKGMQTLTP